jgi:hypothetical protein
MMTAGVTRAEWWNGNGGCGQNGNMSSSLYGFQDFGGFAIFSDGLPTPSYGGCANVTERIPFGTLLPTARALQMLAQSGIVATGQHTVGVTVPAALTTVRAYAVTTANGYGVLLFNMSPSATVVVPLGIDTLASGSAVTSYVYGKAQYDLSNSGNWTGFVRTASGAWQTSLTATLPPYSMSAYMIAR